MNGAACAGHPTLPPETWDLVREGEVSGGTDALGIWARDLRHEAAIGVCGGCPVRLTCLREAIDTRDSGVIRGGVPMGEHTWRADGVRGRAGLPPVVRRSHGGNRRPKPACGTEGGAREHRKQGQPTCGACRSAENEASKERKQRRAARQRAAA